MKAARLYVCSAVVCLGMALVLSGCGEDGGGGPDQVDLILNAATKAEASTHWVCQEYPLGGDEIALYEDGTGTSTSTAGGYVDFAWTKVGPDALIVNSPDSKFPDVRAIKGSFSSAAFTANVGGANDLTHTLVSGALP